MMPYNSMSTAGTWTGNNVFGDNSTAGTVTPQQMTFPTRGFADVWQGDGSFSRGYRRHLPGKPNGHFRNRKPQTPVVLTLVSLRESVPIFSPVGRESDWTGKHFKKIS